MQELTIVRCIGLCRVRDSILKAIWYGGSTMGAQSWPRRSLRDDFTGAAERELLYSTRKTVISVCS